MLPTLQVPTFKFLQYPQGTVGDRQRACTFVLQTLAIGAQVSAHVSQSVVSRHGPRALLASGSQDLWGWDAALKPVAWWWFWLLPTFEEPCGTLGGLRKVVGGCLFCLYLSHKAQYKQTRGKPCSL